MKKTGCIICFLAIHFFMALVSAGSVYRNSLGYPRHLTGSDFRFYDPHFEKNNLGSALTKKTSFEGLYYKVAVNSIKKSRAFVYIKFRKDGSFFTSQCACAPEEMDTLLKEPVDDLGYYTTRDNDVLFEFKKDYASAKLETGRFVFFETTVEVLWDGAEERPKEVYLLFTRG
jgi:hypothetical protein